MTARVALIVLASLFSSTSALAQAAAPVTAQSAYDAKDWKTCAVLYGEQADRPVPTVSAAYNAACCLSLAGDIDGAFKRLEATPVTQLRSGEGMARDADLASLHVDPRWQPLLDRLNAEKIQREAGYDQALRRELNARVERDQDIRNRVLSDDRNPALLDEEMQIDIQNTAWLASVIEKQGWPLASQVGPDGAHNAWVLAQHADRAPAFQDKVLSLLHAAVLQGEAAGQDLAYLTDRVRTAQGKPQLYGTQFQQVNGILEPKPIEDLAQVDTRRAAVGLNTMAEYVAMGEKTLHKKIRWPTADAGGN